MKDILLITPPFTQLNTPYPATPYLKGFLNTIGLEAYQMDLGMEVILTLFSKDGLQNLFAEAENDQTDWSENALRIFSLREDYQHTITDTMAFLQGKNPSFARQICSGQYLPQASRFDQPDELDWAFGSMGFQDKAKHLATLYLEDLSDFIVECVDENFGFSRYAERLGRSANSFDELYTHLQQPPTFIDQLTIQLLKERLEPHTPQLICFSVPFPGNLYSAFRCAQWIKSHYPHTKIAMGGGFPNTELRSLSDPRVFSFFDYITLDDGELPIELIAEQTLHPDRSVLLKRTFLLENGEVVYQNSSPRPDYKQTAVGTPDYSDLPLSEYISVIEMANPMHSLWSDGRWNKLTMAHGCYWGKCTFCDISLDYIRLYEPIAARTLVDRMEAMIAQTGEKGFHFVDEAAPPALMREVALEIIRRKLSVTWWTNIRFEKSFTRDLCVLLKASGCIAVSGGLEVASDRLLQLIDKGVTVEQVARVTSHFTDAGMMVHAYLMYGYPTQTVQETIDSLEMVRQLFELGVMQSGFWHQFALTAHSPVGLNPDAYGIQPVHNDISFANNDIQFSDRTGIDHGQFSFGLKKSLYNYMHGIGFELPLQEWFDFKIPRTSVKRDFIENCLETDTEYLIRPTARILWLGGTPAVSYSSRTKKGKIKEMMHLTIQTRTDALQVNLEKSKGQWLLAQLAQLTPDHPTRTLAQLKAEYDAEFGAFEQFWYSKPIDLLRDHGLLAL